MLLKSSKSIDFDKYKETEEYWAKVDETYQNSKKIIRKIYDESVKDTLDLIENKYSDFQLKEMNSYIKDTERMIFLSFVEKPGFKTRKAFQNEFLKAMVIRADEFYKKYGTVLDYMEGYFRYIENES